MIDTSIPAAPQPATVQLLRETIRGEALQPGDGGYADAAPIWNGMFDNRRPALIVRCRGAADVIAAIDVARSHALPVAVRGGGHSVAGFSTCDGGIVVDLSLMRSVHVDPVARRALMAGGATWGDVDHETQVFGLATTGGLISTTGVAGLTLGGGIGWLMRKHGLACDNLVGADIVTADGRLVHASRTENADLLWGLRGGGGNFGVVASLELALHPVGPVVYAGPIFFPAAAGRDLLRFYRDWTAGLPDDVTTLAVLGTAPDIPVVPAEWHGKPVALVLLVHAGSHDEAERLHGELRAVATPIADAIGPMPYTFMQSLVDDGWEKGIHAYFKAANLAALDDRLIDALCALHAEAPGPQCEIHVHQMGGAVARVAESATAFSERTMPFVLNAVAGWRERTLTESHVAWARAVVDAAGTASTGRAYGNFLGDAASAAVSYGPEAYRRLAALKAEYDPTNLFHLNQNVLPAMT